MVKSTYCSYKGLVSSTLAHSYLSHQFRGIQLGTTHAHDAYTHMQASTHTCRIKTLCSISSAFTENPVLCWLTLILEDYPSPCAFQRSKKKGGGTISLKQSPRRTHPQIGYSCSCDHQTGQTHLPWGRICFGSWF